MNTKTVGLASGKHSHHYLLLLLGIDAKGLLLCGRTMQVIDDELGTEDFIRIDDVAIDLEDYEPVEEDEDDYDDLDEPQTQELNITELVELIYDSLEKLHKKMEGVEFRQEQQYLETVSEDFNEFRRVLGV